MVAVDRDGNCATARSAPTSATPKIVSTALWGYMHGVLQLASTKANVLAHDGMNDKDLVEQALVMATRSLEART